MPVSKEKVKFIVHLYPETLEKVNELFQEAECKSRSQFIERAIRFYIGYLSANNEESYLPNAMLSNMKSIVVESENKISNAFYKVAVELAMVQNAFAYSHKDVTTESLEQLRESIEQEVKSINGILKLEDAVEWQKEE